MDHGDGRWQVWGQSTFRGKRGGTEWDALMGQSHYWTPCPSSIAFHFKLILWGSAQMLLLLIPGLGGSRASLTPSLGHYVLVCTHWRAEKCS